MNPALREDEVSMDSLAVHSQVLRMKTMLDRCSSTSDISSSHVVDDSVVLVNGRSKAVTPLTVDTRLALAAAASSGTTAKAGVVNGDGDGPAVSQPASCSSTSPPTPNSDIRVCHRAVLLRTSVSICRVAARMENLEKSGNLRVIGEKSGKIEKVRENVFLFARNLANWFSGKSLNLLPTDVRF